MKKLKTKNDVPFELREKIDIARRERFKCESCCLTESAQYKIMFAEATAENNGLVWTEKDDKN
jgi:hypothetical protein